MTPEQRDQYLGLSEGFRTSTLGYGDGGWEFRREGGHDGWFHINDDQAQELAIASMIVGLLNHWKDQDIKLAQSGDKHSKTWCETPDGTSFCDSDGGLFGTLLAACLHASQTKENSDG